MKIYKDQFTSWDPSYPVIYAKGSNLVFAAHRVTNEVITKAMIHAEVHKNDKENKNAN